LQDTKVTLYVAQCHWY